MRRTRITVIITVTGMVPLTGYSDGAAVGVSPHTGAALVGAADSDASHPILDLSRKPKNGIVDTAGERRPGASYLRLHLRLSAEGEIRQLRAVIKDGFNQSIEEIDLVGPSGNRDLWTKIIPGDQYFIAVVGEGASSGATLSVVDVIRDTAPIEVQGYVPGGPYWEAVASVGNDPALITVAKSIARLHIIRADKTADSCTGFLIGTQQLLTNQHCVGEERDCQTTIAAFDQGADVPDPSVQTKCAKLIDVCKSLDYALLELSSVPTGVSPVSISSVVPGPPSALRIIQHGWDLPERVSRRQCQVVALPVDGGAPASDITYSCDTIQSSSGSPVLDANNQVVALHHWQKPNEGVLISKIAEAVQKKRPCN